jgi:hypothetical protein
MRPLDPPHTLRRAIGIGVGVAFSWSEPMGHWHARVLQNGPKERFQLLYDTQHPFWAKTQVYDCSPTQTTWTFHAEL